MNWVKFVAIFFLLSLASLGSSRTVFVNAYDDERGTDCTGTGFFVSRNHVITAAHLVFRNDDEMDFKWDRVYVDFQPARVVAYEPYREVCLLYVPTGSSSYYSLINHDVSRGMGVTAYGNFAGSMESSSGVVVGFSGPFAVATSSTRKGFSGGPVFDGIGVCGLTSQNDIHGRSWFLSVYRISSWLKSVGFGKLVH